MDKNREIRSIMLGKVVNDNGVLRAPRSNERFYLNGASNGFGDVLFFGLMKKESHYRVKDPKEALKKVETAFSCIGRKVALESHPEAIACIKRDGLNDIMFYAAEMEGQDLVITAFTGKHLMGFLTLPNSLSKIEKRLPSDFERVAYVKPKKNKKKRKNTKTSDRRKKMAGAIYDLKDRLGVENNDFEALQDNDEE